MSHRRTQPGRSTEETQRTWTESEGFEKESCTSATKRKPGARRDNAPGSSSPPSQIPFPFATPLHSSMARRLATWDQRADPLVDLHRGPRARQRQCFTGCEQRVKGRPRSTSSRRHACTAAARLHASSMEHRE
eukprot:508605-Rhodomonas_salina.1